MESSIAQMMGESDRHHPISTTLFKKSKSPTNKKRELIHTYLSFVVSIFQPNSVDLVSSSNQLVCNET